MSTKLEPIPTGKCEVCDKEITFIEEHVPEAISELYSYHPFCDEHIKHKFNLNHDKERVKLGLPEKHKYVCGICGSVLSPEEKESVHPRDFYITCNDHRFFSRYFMLDLGTKRVVKAMEECFRFPEKILKGLKVAIKFDDIKEGKRVYHQIFGRVNFSVESGFIVCDTDCLVTLDEEGLVGAGYLFINSKDIK